MKSITRICLSACSALLLTGSASQASVLLFSGTYTANYSGGPIPVLSTTFQFAFDNSIVNPVGNQAYHNLPLISLSMTPASIGATTFTTANTGASLFYTNNNLTFLTIGGLIDGSAGLQGNGPNPDFYINQNLTNNTFGNGIYNLPPSGTLGSGGNGTASLTITVIPEPASLGAISLGATTLLRRRR